MASNIDLHYNLSQEEESQLLDILKASSQYEITVTETILKYMLIYEKALRAEQSGDFYRSENYLSLLFTMSEALNLTKDAWIQSLNHVRQFSESHGLAELFDEGYSEGSSLSFEKHVLTNINKLEDLIDSTNIKYEGNKDKYFSLITVWKQAKQGWQTMLEQRQNLLKMGGNDFFELFDEG